MSEICTINPATEQVCATYPLMNQKEVEYIIQQMHKAQQRWAETSFDERKKCLFNTAQLLRENKEYHANLITNEMGKPITQAISEIEKCAHLFDYYAAEGENYLKPEMIQTEFSKSYRCFQPLGTILAIMPWNFPYWQVMRFAAPNLMLGNAGLLKHAPNSTGAAMAIAQLFMQAGFPEYLFYSIVIDIDLVPFIIHHPNIAGITLTGSNRAGQFIAMEAGSALKKCVLELGGSDPYLILEDADLEIAAEQCVFARLGINTGQSCISAKRLIVVDKVKSQFTSLVIEKAKSYLMGDPSSHLTQLGPLARADLRDKLHNQVQNSINKGAQCALGGILPHGQGYYYPATILLDVPHDSPAALEELFGPVICILDVKKDEDAIELANQTSYGLGSAIFTRNVRKGEAFAKQIYSGTSVVNTYVASDPRLPFGGIKQSGYGRELSIEGIREFSNIKTIIIK